MRHANLHSIIRVAAVWALVVAGLFASSVSPTHARLDPYYILRADGFEGLRPRILIAIDTSGSMAAHDFALRRLRLGRMRDR